MYFISAFDIIRNNRLITRLSNKLIFLLILSSLLSGCYGTKYLDTNQRLLINQKIKGTRKTKLEDIETSFAQKTARRLSLTTRLYQWGEHSYNPAKYSKKIAKTEKKYDAKIAATKRASKIRKLKEKKIIKTKKYKDKIQFGNTLMQWGKPLAIYDQTLTETTVSNIRKKLNSEGYFNNTVFYNERFTAKKAFVTYEVSPMNPYIIDSVNYLIPDNAVKELVTRDKLVNVGQRYRQTDLTKERDRIRTLLANSGYYGFSKQYVNFEIDTTIRGEQKVLVNVRISNPKGKQKHSLYELDSVIFVSDTDSKIRVKRRQKTYNRITYDYIRDIYSNKILDWRIFIYPDSLYSEKNTFETQKQLSNINNFKFINVKYDTTGGDFIAHIFTGPLKRFETSSEIGINSREGLPGPFINFGLINRNTFEGLENVDLNFNLEVIGLNRFAEDSTTNDIYDSYEYGGNLTFSFPQFLLPLNKKLKSRLGKYNPTTYVSAGITFVDRSDFTRNTFNTSITYNWQTTGNNTRYGLTLADIRFIGAEIEDGFQKRLDSLQQEGNTFARSFDPGFVSSSIFTFTKDIKEYGNLRRPSSFLRGYAEIGGNILNIFSESPFGDDIAYYKFLKASIDYRHHIPLGNKTALAFRVNSGFAFPYGSIDSTNANLPYEKFFFAGGSNSIKAWQPRRLGPGSYSGRDENGNISYQIEQPGDIIFESGVELRTKLFGFLNWAYFIDIGNVWTWYEDRSREGAQFKLNRFASELAVGTGMGLRLDFSFLLVRVDLGIKVFDPAQELGRRFVLDDFQFSTPENPENLRVINTPQLNIGIGYPF